MDENMRPARHSLTILGATYKHGGVLRLEDSKGLAHGTKGTVRMDWNDLIKIMADGRAKCYGADFLKDKRNIPAKILV